ncbi:MAG: hypothetical protein JSR44_15770 [Spirochaetes bacterium]|nr:hypothetical protein [Spirochaetota bacterium]
MKRWIVFCALILTALTHCKRSTIFTEIDASFRVLDDVFVSEFKGQPRTIEKNTTLDLSAKEAKTGRFGTLLTLDVWEFGDAAEAKQGYETLVATEKQNVPREFDQVRSNEFRYSFVRVSQIAGEIFTVKKVLFRILGENKDTVQEYLIASKLGRLR